MKVFTEVGKGDSDEGDIMMFVTYSLLVNPEKLTQKFSEISVFWGVTLRKLKTHPVFFSKFQFPGHKLDCFFGNSSINFLWVAIQFLLNIGAWARPISGKSDEFPEIGYLDEFSKNRSSSCPVHVDSFKAMQWNFSFSCNYFPRVYQTLHSAACSTEVFLNQQGSVLEIALRRNG